MDDFFRQWLEKTERKLKAMEHVPDTGAGTPHERYAGRKRGESRPPLLVYPPGESPMERGLCPVRR
jgi:hypothetical protein